MHMSDLFPPGRVLWAIRDGDLHPSHRTSLSDENRVRLFEVLDVEKMFGQIIFARDMLRYDILHALTIVVILKILKYISSSHLPHQYDRVLHEVL